MALANMTQHETDEHNREHCKSIAKRLSSMAQGIGYECPYCGHEIDDPSDELLELLENEEPVECPCCHHEETFEPFDFVDWLNDSVFDIKWILDSDREYFACRLMVACGGPNIYIDTFRESVELFWWGDRAYYPLDSYAIEFIDDNMRELFHC